MELKFNGNIYSEGKINGQVISFIEPSIELKINNNTGKNLTYYYADSSNILADYSAIISLNSGSSFTNMNELNVAPSNATRIIGKDTSNNIVAEMAIPQYMQKTLGTLLYKVGLISDIHIDAYEEDYGDSQNDFIKALNLFNALGVEFIVINGDLVNEGYEVDYQKYVELVNNYSNGIPIKTLRGNHECYYDGGYNASNTRYADYIGTANYYEHIKNNDVYLFLSAMKEDGNNLISEQTTWLSQKLAGYTDKRVFLFTHYPYGEVGTVGNLFDKTQMSNSVFLNLIKQYKNIVYFSGHTHTNFDSQTLNKYANIKKANDICHRVHISSLARPRVYNGTSFVNTPSGSEGYVMEIYENGILLKGYDFANEKYVAIAQYFLEI